MICANEMLQDLHLIGALVSKDKQLKCVPDDVVVKVVVARHGYKTTQTCAEREENLDCCIAPHLPEFFF